MYHYLGLPIECTKDQFGIGIKEVKFELPEHPIIEYHFGRYAFDINVFSEKFWAYQYFDTTWHLCLENVELTDGLKVLYVEVPKYKNDHKGEFLISLKMPDGKWFWIAHFKDKIVLQSVNMGLIKREFTKLKEAFDFLRSIYGEKHDAK
ncbi:MAG: hypothetical protein WC495_05580 [Patescibacteria group bacterium]